LNQQDKTDSKILPQNKHRFIILTVIFLFALLLRIHSSDSYRAKFYHPDENTMLNSVVNYPGEPNTYNYGTLPMYLGGFYRSLSKQFCGLLHCDTAGFYPYGLRVITALADSLTVIFIFLSAGLLSGFKTAVLSSLLFALSVLNIQLSHFFLPDIYAAFLFQAHFIFALKSAKKEIYSATLRQEYSSGRRWPPNFPCCRLRLSLYLPVYPEKTRIRRPYCISSHYALQHWYLFSSLCRTHS